MKRTRLNRYSEKKVDELNDQVNIRVRMCLLADGNPQQSMRRIRFNNGKEKVLWTVLCTDGICQECGKRVSFIEPHEDPLRSRGGKVGKDSKMICRSCHNKKHNGGGNGKII